MAEGSAGSDVALATAGLAKRYGPRVALDGLDLRVPTGVVYGFLGPNGAGKTTTMRILTGLIRPDAGRVELLGRPFGRGDRRRLFEVGALIEAPSFYPYLSGRENLRALAATGAPTPAARVDELLDLVNLRDRAGDKVSGYSLGMKQRLGIASALLSDPRLLLLDEPANGLDPAGIAGMRETLRGLAAAGKTVFVSSHMLSEVQQLADVVGIVARGRLVREGRIDDLLREEASVRIRVEPADVAAAGPVLERVAGPGLVSRGPRPRRRLARGAGRPRPRRGAQPGAGRRRRVRLADRGRDDARGALPRAHGHRSGRRRDRRRRTSRSSPGGRHEAVPVEPAQAADAARDLGDVPAAAGALCARAVLRVPRHAARHGPGRGDRGARAADVPERLRDRRWRCSSARDRCSRWRTGPPWPARSGAGGRSRRRSPGARGASSSRWSGTRRWSSPPGSGCCWRT